MIRKRKLDLNQHLRALKKLHASVIINGFNTDRSNLKELLYLSAVASSQTINYAHQVFDKITEPDLFMWNTIIRGSAQSNNPLMAVSLYAQMEKHHVWPDNYTFPFVLKACTRLSWDKLGSVIHGKIMKHGFEHSTFSRNTLIYFHANCGDISVAHALFRDSSKRDVIPWSALTAGYARRGKLDVARKLFDGMPVKDLVSWNVMITAYAKRGKMQSARELFDEMPKRDVVTWNAMIAGYVLSRSNELALEMFEAMSQMGEQPDEVTMLSLVSACANSGALDIGTKLHHILLKMGYGNLNVLLGNSLIDMYAKCGSIEKARKVFCGMREKDTSTWNSIIGGLAFHGHSEESLFHFKEMRKTRVKPDAITFVGVLVACSHAGEVEKGREYFKMMTNQYKIEANIRHYGCMVDIFGRAGLLREAFEFIGNMEIEPNCIIWRTLLGACKIHGNVEMGRRANEELLKLRRDESGDYVLLSNIYASTSQWDGAQKIRKLMDCNGVRKESGFSLVEADIRSN